MRFLLDANVRRSLGVFLQAQGHNVRFLAGTPEHDAVDDTVLDIATREERIIVTNDHDFGTLIYLRRLPHRGVVFFRLTDDSADSYREKMQQLLARYGEQLQNHFIVVTDLHIRFR